jgi:hypothetical protein
MSIYFSNFPKDLYSFNDFYEIYVTNIVSRISFEQKFMNNAAAYYVHRIKDGETPEGLAYKIYGNSERHWIILLMNEIIDPLYDWPLNYESFNKYIISKYNSIEYAMSNMHSYYKVTTSTINQNSPSRITNVEKIRVDFSTYTDILENPNDYTYQVITLADGNSLSRQVSAQAKSFYDYETEQNEAKRSIKILKQEFVSSAVSELKKVFEK